MSKKENKKPVIVFLTAPWSNVDENIRAGKPPGGVVTIAPTWEACVKGGFDVHVFITCNPERDWPKETVQLNGVKFHWIQGAFPRLSEWLVRKEWIGLVKPLWAMNQLKVLMRIIQVGVVPDIIFCMRPTYGLLGLIWSRIVGAKCVLRGYGSPLHAIWCVEKKWLPRIATLGALMTFKFPFDLFIMDNDGSQADVFVKKIGVPSKRFRFWLHGVDKKLRIPGFDKKSFKQNKLGLSPDTPIVMTLGRLAAINRLDRAIDAMVDIHKAVPEARLVMVGGGELRDELQQRVDNLGLTDVVKFVGPVPHEEIKYYLNVSDVFIQANDRTNLRLVLVEAMSAGCCIVTRDIGGTTQVAKHNSNAVVLSPGEAPEIAEEVIRLLQDPEERKRLSENVYRFAMENFQDLQERVEMEVQTLKKLIGAEEKS